MARRNADRYVPGNLPNTPEGLIQFLYDELPRISAAINKLPAGVSLRYDDQVVSIGPVLTEYPLFIGQTPLYDLPGGGWNAATGEWTAPATGLYQINSNIIVEPFGAGNKDYFVELRLYINDVLVFRNAAVGDDAFELSCSLAVSGRIQREDILRWTFAAVHEQFVGDITYDAYSSVTSTALE